MSSYRRYYLPRVSWSDVKGGVWRIQPYNVTDYFFIFRVQNLLTSALLRISPHTFAFIQICPCALVVETVVIARLFIIFCPVLPQSAKVCIIIKLECRGKRIKLLSWLNPAASHWGSIDGVLVSAYIARTLADTSVPEQQNSRTSSPTTTFVSIRWNWIFTFAFSGPQDLPDGY